MAFAAALTFALAARAQQDEDAGPEPVVPDDAGPDLVDAWAEPDAGNVVVAPEDYCLCRAPGAPAPHGAERAAFAALAVAVLAARRLRAPRS